MKLIKKMAVIISKVFLVLNEFLLSMSKITKKIKKF